MTDIAKNAARIAWTKPELVSLDANKSDIENGTNPGSDGILETGDS
ncbi:MAG: hypothetical protein AAGK02_16025 [Pseudomonadota bacterium]